MTGWITDRPIAIFFKSVNNLRVEFLRFYCKLILLLLLQELSLLDDTVLEAHNESAELTQIIPLDGGKALL